MEVIKEQRKRWLLLLVLVPFIFGTIGYEVAGVDRISDAMYGGISLYSMNLQDGYQYNIWLEIARWTGPLVTATAILFVCRWLGQQLRWKVTGCFRDSIAVYCDDDTRIAFDGKKSSVIYPGREFVSNAKSQIIMLESDEESIQFYERHQKALKNRKVYIGLREISCGLVREKKEISFFDIDGAISRDLWKNRVKLWEMKTPERPCNITICGTGHLGRNMLNYALMLNLYSLKQSITYNFVGDNDIYQIEHSDFQTQNQDEIKYYTSKDKEVSEILRKSDYVILTQAVPVEQLQVIGVLCSNGEIYYYDPQGDSALHGNTNAQSGIGGYLAFPNLHPYGSNEIIFTDENIRKNQLIAEAMQQNFEYERQQANVKMGDTTETKWGELDSFKKWSNISSSDFSTVVKSLASKKNIDELAELEHIRWCRFHYLNHWKYGEQRNDEQKIHTCLMPYDKLSREDQEKDISTIEGILGK